MKKHLGTLLTAFVMASTFSATNASASQIGDLGNLSYDRPLVNHIRLVSYINPLWGVNTGFHRVQTRWGSYIRSNPDGYCYNNKYGC